MPITLPKEFIGFRHPKTVPFELNNVNLDTLLPPIFRLAILEGRDSSRANSDNENVETSVQRLTTSDRLIGFEGTASVKLLDKIVRSSLIRTVRARKTSAPEIDGLIPYSIASFKAGFPTNQAGFRQVDRFLYHLLLSKWDNNADEVHKFLVSVFGEGVVVQGYPSPDVRRAPGSHPSIDVMTELSIAYIDVFDPVTPKRSAKQYLPANPLPNFGTLFARDLYRFLWSYKDRVPTALLVEQIITLIAFELTVFTVKLMHALPELCTHPEQLPMAMKEDSDPLSPPEIYVDMTGNHRSLSRTMASGCIRRDLAQIDPFMRSVFLLRYLDYAVGQLKGDPTMSTLIGKHLKGKDTPGYLQALLLLEQEPNLKSRFDGLVLTHRQSIISVNRSQQYEDPYDEPASDAQRLLDAMREEGKTPIEQIQELLYSAQAAKTRSNISGWFTSVGGFRKPYGLINGHTDRRSWTFAPTNELLSVLVQMRAVDYPRWNPTSGARPKPFGLQGFLEWLELRFGIIIDRPPSDLGFDSPEHMAAARDNLQAMLRRLRQMGIFADQSDDFSVQQLSPPFLELDKTTSIP